MLHDDAGMTAQEAASGSIPEAGFDQRAPLRQLRRRRGAPEVLHMVRAARYCRAAARWGLPRESCARIHIRES